jgi:hypothetical protein
VHKNSHRQSEEAEGFWPQRLLTASKIPKMVSKFMKHVRVIEYHYGVLNDKTCVIAFKFFSIYYFYVKE